MPDNRTKYTVDVLLDPTNFPDYTGSVIWDPYSGSFAITSSAPGGGGNQNLQQVTDVGDETTNQSLFLSGTLHDYAEQINIDATSGFIIDGDDAKTHITPQFTRAPQIILTTLAKNNRPGPYPYNYITYGGASITEGDGHGGDTSEICIEKITNQTLSNNLLDYATVSVGNSLALYGVTAIQTVLSLEVNTIIQISDQDVPAISVIAIVTAIGSVITATVQSIENQPLPGGDPPRGHCVSLKTRRFTSLVVGGAKFNDGVSTRQGTGQIVITNNTSTTSGESKGGLLLTSEGNIYFFNSSSKSTDTSGSLSPVSASAKISLNYDNTLKFLVKDPAQANSSSFTEVMFISKSGDEPRIGIGFNKNDSDKVSRYSAFEIKSAQDSTDGTEVFLRGSRRTTGPQAGDTAGAIYFMIDSGSYNTGSKENFIQTASLASIDSIVTFANDKGAYGNLRLNAGQATSDQRRALWTMGYTTDPYKPSSFGSVTTGSLLIKKSQAGSVSNGRTQITLEEFNSTSNIQLYHTEKSFTTDSATLVEQFYKSDYHGAFYDYILVSESASRTGQLMVSWDDSGVAQGSVTISDTSTKAIGAAGTPFFTAVNFVSNPASIIIRITNGNGYTFKALAKLM